MGKNDRGDLKASSDGDGATITDVEMGKLFLRNGSGGVDRGTALRDNAVLKLFNLI